MGIEERYDPEDIEQLMIDKPFDQLLEDERQFVLKHVSDEDEYERIRSTMFMLKEHIDDEHTAAPRPDMRRELIAAFKKEKKRNYRYWLNSVGAFFLPQGGRSIWIPVFRIASILLLLGGLWIGFDAWQQMAREQQFAEVNERESISEDQDTEERNEEFKVADEQPDQQNELPPTTVKEPASNTPAILEETELTGEVRFDASPEIVEDEMAGSDLDYDLSNTVPLTAPKTAYSVEETTKEATMDFVPQNDLAETEAKNKILALDDEQIIEDVEIADKLQKTTVQSLSVESISATRASIARKDGGNRPVRASRSLAQDAQLIGLLTQAL